MGRKGLTGVTLTKRGRDGDSECAPKQQSTIISVGGRESNGTTIRSSTVIPGFRGRIVHGILVQGIPRIVAVTRRDDTSLCVRACVRRARSWCFCTPVPPPAWSRGWLSSPWLPAAPRGCDHKRESELICDRKTRIVSSNDRGSLHCLPTVEIARAIKLDGGGEGGKKRRIGGGFGGRLDFDNNDASVI